MRVWAVGLSSDALAAQWGLWARRVERHGVTAKQVGGSTGRRPPAGEQAKIRDEEWHEEVETASDPGHSRGMAGEDHAGLIDQRQDHPDNKGDLEGPTYVSRPRAVRAGRNDMTRSQAPGEVRALRQTAAPRGQRSRY